MDGHSLSTHKPHLGCLSLNIHALHTHTAIPHLYAASTCASASTANWSCSPSGGNSLSERFGLLPTCNKNSWIPLFRLRTLAVIL